MILERILTNADYHLHNGGWFKAIDQFTDIMYDPVENEWFISGRFGMDIKLFNIDNIEKAEILHAALQGK